ncbi:MAG: response regulator transcription factor [Clostridia bacterium]|nr:response regulator transcription factor [Clostridia bacterium]
MRILVADDERDLNAVISKALTIEGYSVDSCYDGEEALQYAELAEYDALVLDIMMPRMSGIDVLKSLRKKGIKVPVLILTAKDSVNDRVIGLDSGADDYLVKPFSFDELFARLRVITRRASGSATNSFTVADLVVDCEKKLVFRAGKEIKLTSREFAILELLIRNKGIVLSREKIEEHILSYDYDGSSNIIDVYIRYLRRKIDDDYEVKLIQTVRGFGYVIREK